MLGCVMSKLGHLHGKTDDSVYEKSIHIQNTTTAHTANGN